VVRFAVQGNLVKGMSGELERYRRFVVNGQWDIVAMHCAQIWTTDALLDMLRSEKSPFVLVSHGLSAWQNSAYGEYFDLLGAALRESAQIVSLSPMLEEGAFCAKYGLTPPCVIVNGVNLSEWTADSFGLRNRWGVGSRPWVLSVGNHSSVSVKGHDRFHRLSQNLRKQHHDVRCTIIGGSHPAARWDLGRLGIPGGCWLSCRFRSLLSRVELRKNVSRRDVVAAIKEADVVAITSRREACPLVAIEAMAAGTPWVSFDVGNVRENAGGYVVRDEQQMLEKVLLLLGNCGLRRELGEAGRRRAQERHDWDKIAHQYEQLYISAVSGQTPAGVGRKV
jgi:glycosyltransferase involved in cell wall biosynthesis